MEGAGRPGLHAHRPRTEARLNPPKRIGIFGHVGNGNLGDEAIIAAVIQGIRARVPHAELVGFTTRPEDTRRRHGIESYPIRRGVTAPAPNRPAPVPQGAAEGPPPESGLRKAVRRVPGLYTVLSAVRDAVQGARDSASEAAFWVTRYQRLRGLDLLIVAGSNQLSDYVGGPWNFPYSVFAWTTAARLAGVRVAFLSVGAGPVRSRFSGALIRHALDAASFRSFRDVGSREAVEGIGFRGSTPLAPDLAHGLKMDVIPKRGGAGVRTVVVNPLPYYDPRFWAENDPAIYARYVALLAEFAATLKRRGYRVRFVATQLRADPPVIADIVRRLPARDGASDPGDRVDPPVERFEDLLAILGEADVVIATRFHGVVLAQMLGKPTIGIAYRRSTSDLLMDVGQGAYAIDITRLTLEGLLDRFDALEADRGAEKRIADRLAQHRRALDAQYDELLGVVR
ncbi:MAG: polysaccharide pyruvyl transferase family protein [Candidatus Eiseniibacteriota bacterium]